MSDAVVSEPLTQVDESDEELLNARPRGLMDRIACKVDTIEGASTRWVATHADAVTFDDVRRSITIKNNKGDKRTIPLDAIRGVLFRTMARRDGFSDLLIRVNENGSLKWSYMGTFKRGSQPRQEALGALEHAKLIARPD